MSFGLLLHRVAGSVPIDPGVLEPTKPMAAHYSTTFDGRGASSLELRRFSTEVLVGCAPP